MVIDKRCDMGDRVCKNIKILRKKAGISQESLEEIAGVGHRYINSVERYVFYPSYQALERIADALNIEPYKLFIEDINIDYKEDVNKKINCLLDRIYAFQVKAKLVEKELEEMKIL